MSQSDIEINREINFSEQTPLIWSFKWHFNLCIIFIMSNAEGKLYAIIWKNSMGKFNANRNKISILVYNGVIGYKHNGN